MNLISTFYGEIYKDFKIDNFKQKWSNGQGGGGGDESLCQNERTIIS